MKEFIKTLKEPIICGILIVIGLIVKEDTSKYFYILAIVLGGYSQTKEGIEDTINNKHLNVELLMILSAIGACIIGNYKEGAILIFIFSLSGALEELTLDRSKREIQSLMNLQPNEALLLLEDGSTKSVDVESLSIGDKVLVTKGSVVPSDGLILVGETSIEEASITGESMPKQKGIGAMVYGGTLNISQPITVEVTKTSDDILIKKIVKMVEEAESHPSKTSAYIDRLEDYYARIVLVIVALVIVIPVWFMGVPLHDAFYKGMVLLVVASPCALIASVTPATLAAISNGAKNGILVKGGVYFESLVDTKAIAFDKTGTLTYGEPQVTDLFMIEELEHLPSLITNLERHSAHPLASALVKEYSTSSAEIDIQKIQETSGEGIAGYYHNNYIQLGKKSFIENSNPLVLEEASQYASEGKSLVYIGVNSKMIGVIAMKDVLREDAKELIHALNNQGIETIMITGDVEKTAQSIGKELGITKVIAELLPKDKLDIVKQLEKEYETVVMVGDGINDAPALANATIGIAMSGGTDIAMESADILLVKDDLQNIEYAYKLSKKLRKVVLENIIFSISVIVLLIFMNFTDNINLPLGVIGHEGSTILVILNGLRLLRGVK